MFSTFFFFPLFPFYFLLYPTFIEIFCMNTKIAGPECGRATEEKVPPFTKHKKQSDLVLVSQVLLV